MRKILNSKTSLNASLWVLTAIAITTLNATLASAYGIEADGILTDYGQAVHETITQRSALASGLLKIDQQQEMKHLTEGVRFNDDPKGHLLQDNNVVNFALQFLGKNKKVDDANDASHFGDYQFLHSMGNGSQTPEQIKQKIILYAYHLWLIGSGQLTLEQYSQDYDLIVKREEERRQGTLDPNFRYTRDQLIIRKTVNIQFPRPIMFFHAENQMQFQYRALGSLLHIIQDSYAKGHVVRVGWEAGTNSGRIRYFQNYSEQDSKEHEKHDLNHNELVADNFTEIPGAQAAWDRSTQMLNLIKNKCPWTSVKGKKNVNCGKNQSVFGFLNDEVFAFEKSGGELRNTRSHSDLIPKPKEIDPYGPGGIYQGGG